MNIESELVKIIQGTLQNTNKTSAYDTSAEVRRIDEENGLAWVHIAGGVDETPVRMTMNAKQGDNVQVRVVNGTAFLIGNATAPPTDDTQALVAKKVATKADDKASDAIDSAMTAQAAAETAVESAETAELAASVAQASADVASTSAYNAMESAVNAKTQADSATSSANTAYYQLGEFEKVMNVLKWVSEHGTYVLTQDTVPQDGKWYFESDGGSVVTPQPNPSLQGWYELATSTFELSEDTEVDTHKTYFEKTGETTYSPIEYPVGNPHERGYYELTSATYTASADTSVADGKLYFTSAYDLITNPTANPALLGLYELEGVDEAVTNYISTHLALTDDGLVVQMDEEKAKLKVTATGVDIIGADGSILAQYATTVTLGNSNGAHLWLSSDNGLGFYEGEHDALHPEVNRVAYIDRSKLYITSAEITSNLRIGSFIWSVQSPTRISLRYSP